MYHFKNYLPGILWTLLIFILSSLPATSLHLPSFWDLFSLDKLAHASFYCILFIAWNYSLRKSGYILSKKQLILLLLCCMLYGGALELYQGYCLTDRTADWVDEVANSVGAVGGYIYVSRNAL
ncbi:MAG: VanZ family protein [Bacteroidota bacterium]